MGAVFQPKARASLVFPSSSKPHRGKGVSDDESDDDELPPLISILDPVCAHKTRLAKYFELVLIAKHFSSFFQPDDRTVGIVLGDPPTRMGFFDPSVSEAFRFERSGVCVFFSDLQGNTVQMERSLMCFDYSILLYRLPAFSFRRQRLQ